MIIHVNTRRDKLFRALCDYENNHEILRTEKQGYFQGLPYIGRRGKKIYVWQLNMCSWEESNRREELIWGSGRNNGLQSLPVT
ncbi:MAG: hypothetical protein LBQ80_01980 [Clostridium sp.]|jgi:hypothetical protein|nr:hypothetical protein [Clostridium sp.]